MPFRHILIDSIGTLISFRSSSLVDIYIIIIISFRSTHTHTHTITLNKRPWTVVTAWPLLADCTHGKLHVVSLTTSLLGYHQAFVVLYIFSYYYNGTTVQQPQQPRRNCDESIDRISIDQMVANGGALRTNQQPHHAHVGVTAPNQCDTIPTNDCRCWWRAHAASLGCVDTQFL